MKMEPQRYTRYPMRALPRTVSCFLFPVVTSRLYGLYTFRQRYRCLYLMYRHLPLISSYIPIDFIEVAKLSDGVRRTISNYVCLFSSKCGVRITNFNSEISIRVTERKHVGLPNSSVTLTFSISIFSF